MEPIDFENNIKDKLDKRTLKPSADAWNTLSERLDLEDKKINNKPYWWIGLAASIIGILFVVSQFSNTNTVVDETPKIVVTPEVIQQVEKKPIKMTSEDIKHKVANPVKEVNVVNKAEKSKFEKLVNKNSIKNVVAEAIEEKTNSIEKEAQVNATELPKVPLTFEDQKIQNIVAQVQALKSDNKEVTDKDIDALLIAAQKEIQLNKQINDTARVVDANMLLQDVEADLDQSFRNKVFEAIKASYSSVKTAVAQRND